MSRARPSFFRTLLTKESTYLKKMLYAPRLTPIPVPGAYFTEKRYTVVLSNSSPAFRMGLAKPSWLIEFGKY